MPKHSDGQSAPADVAFPVVGLGASAGGVTALLEFFEALPATTGAAYVVILHLPPEHRSDLDATLRSATTMPVVQIKERMTLGRNRVYVIAPSFSVTVEGNELCPTLTNDRHAVTIEIDVFFRSLAEARREHAVGIILSGAGPDGSLGIKRIKELGGITMAQCPDQAEHTRMPLAAIDTGMVDFTLGASDMPQRLLDLWTQERRIRLPDALVTPEDETKPESSDPLSADNQRALREILIVLRTRTGHDFRHYKRSSILRRVERRLHVNELTDLRQYRDFLHLYPEETQALLQDMLLSVTQFFRDPRAYEILRTEVLPLLFAQRGGQDPVRVWVAGCATGEEAYSIAMLLQEISARTAERVPFQLFATDIDERAIEVARRGIYSEAILADVGTERIERFFVKNGPNYCIQKELRATVLFAVHNVLWDPPFSRLDLICCRNVLLYLDRPAQADTLHAFHFALKQNGYLFLGASETADAAGQLFSSLEKKARIFSSTGRAQIAETARRTPSEPCATAFPAQVLSVVAEPTRHRFSFGDLHERLLEEHAFPSVLVNRDSEIVHVSDRAGRFLQFAGGDPSRNILAAVRPELRAELRTTIYSALQSQHRVDAQPVLVEHDECRYAVRMMAHAVHDDEANDDFVLILFDEMQDPEGSLREAPPHDLHGSIVEQLERELQTIKNRLQETVDQYQTSNETLRASNEELQATNAELLAATEALEASQEDLAATNAELTTTNTELKAKVGESSKVNDDLHNLIAANDIGTIFIDRRLCILRFTPRVKEVFSIIESDIGRSLLDVAHRLQYAGLRADVEQAFDSLHLIEREVRATDGRWYSIRVLPYRKAGDVIDGAVVSFIDITSRRIAEERLHSANQMALEEVERRQDEFLAVVSHELKHPLNLISASAELIARSQWTRREPSLARAAGTIARTVKGQAQIIDDLLDISRVRTGNLSLACTEVDLSDAVRRICGIVQEEARYSAVELTVSVPDEPVAIQADPTRIEQVLWNLLSNALKYTDRDGKIIVTLCAEEAFAKLIVSDSGIGIDPSVIPYIFEMFQRGQSTGSTRSGGLGIGLSLVKELVALHAGRVSAHSDGLGQGATFTVELPRLAGGARAAGASVRPVASLLDTEVMLVDDDRDTVEAFKLLLETEGANVIVATAGDEALRILDDHRPTFILSDLGMPGMTGVELIGAVRKRNELSDIKAIALSGFGRDSDVQAALRAGFDAHLTKPVGLDALLNTMARLRTR